MPIRSIPGLQVSGYFDRLSKLIDERIAPDADKARIDARIWELFGAKWAVMFTDLAGFSRCAAEFGIVQFLQTIAESQRLFLPCIDACDGILIKAVGDSMLILFRQPRDAVKCAIDMQGAAAAYNAERTDAEKVLLCVGISFGDVLSIGGEDVFGAPVNAAAKLGEDTAKAGEILVTDSVAQHIAEMAELRLEQFASAPVGVEAVFKLHYRG